MSAPYRPAVIELVQTLGPPVYPSGVPTVPTVWHARIRAAGNRKVVWWSENYPRRSAALHAIELLPGYRNHGVIPASAGGGYEVTFWGTDEPILLRTVDER